MKKQMAVAMLALAGIGGFALSAWNPLVSPSEGRILRPTPGASAGAAPLAGVWESAGPGTIPSRLVVEGVRENGATILFAWGDHPDGNYTGGSIRARARLMPDGTLFWRQLGGLAFRLSADRKSLVATREPANQETVALLHRVPPEAALSALSPDEGR